MSRSTRHRILLVAAILGLAAVSVPQAQACWGWGCWGGGYSPYWSSSWCCTPCYVCCTPSCYTSCWSYGGCFTCDSGCWDVVSYEGCVDVPCCEAAEVRKPVDKGAKPSHQPGPPQPEPAAPAPETDLFPPQPGPPEKTMPTPETSPSETKQGMPGPAPEPAAPGGIEPPTSIPDVRGMPAEPEGPAAPSLPAPAPAEPAPVPKDTAPAPAKPAPSQPQAGLIPAAEPTSGVIGVWVPAKARVVINGLGTTSTGAYREYVSHGLKPGAVYKYEVRAQIARDGRLIEKTRTVYLTAGARQRVAFRFEAKPEEAIAARW